MKSAIFRSFSFYFGFIFFIFSCMDPVIDTDENYSNYQEVDVSAGTTHRSDCQQSDL